MSTIVQTIIFSDEESSQQAPSFPRTSTQQTPFTRMIDMRKGFFAIGIDHVKTQHNIGTLWRSANLFGAAFIFTIGRRYKPQSSDTMQTFRDIPLWHFATIEDLRNHLPRECRLVGVELDAKSEPIKTFQHPKQCVYVLGAEDNGLTRAAMDQCHKLVQLPGRCSMNVSAAGSIVMYDRFVKT